MSQPSFCEQCEIPVFDICQMCGMPANGKDADQNIKPIGSPGDNTDVVMKRFKISSRKKILQYPGFKLYSNKNDGAGWEVVEEVDEIEGNNRWLKWLFGKEKNGYVYYVNHLTLPIKFDWRVPFKGKKYRVHTEVNIRVDIHEYFINEFLNKDAITLTELSAKIEGSAKEQLKHRLVALNTDNINFLLCQNDIHAVCQPILSKLGVDVRSVTMSGEPEVDSVKEKLEEAKKQATNQRELLSHLSTEESLTEQHIDTEKTNTRLVKSENELKVELAEIDKQEKIHDAQTQKDYKALENEWKLTEKEIANQTQKQVKETEGETEVALADIAGQTKKEEALIGLDKIKQVRTKQEVKHALELHKDAKAHFTSLKTQELAEQSCETNVDENQQEVKEKSQTKPSEMLERFSDILTIQNKDGVICQSSDFGAYFWNKLTAVSSELEYLLNNEKLHYVRYEENYCYSIDEIIFLYQVLNQLKQFDCYNKAYSETHLIFGFKKQTMAGLAQPFGRNKLLEQLLKPGGHVSASIKNKIHDREMALIFNNGSQVRIKLSFGLGFWFFENTQLPTSLLESLQNPIDFKDITPELVASIRDVNMPVQNKKHEKDTTISLWGYKPVVD